MRSGKPQPASHGIPALETLQARPQWVCWRRETRHGKASKVPYTPRTGARARSDDPDTWGSYQEAEAACRTQPERYHGLGYMFRGDVTGIDFDHCVREHSTIDAWAWQWIERHSSYAKYSHGDGVHV